MSMQHLIKLGHKRIGLYNAHAELIGSKKRLNAYQIFCEENGLEVDNDFVLNAEYISKEQDNYANVQGYLKKLIAMDSPPTALIAVNSTRAMEIYQTAMELGLKIPSDISLIATTRTGPQFNGFHKTHITSVMFSYEHVGRAAFDLLLDIIQNPDSPPRKIYLQASFFQGDTTTTPPTI